MRYCLICDKNIADKKGSHIVPHFLMKRIDNEIGQKEREKELGFVITGNYTVSYFGRGIQPEKLEELYGEVTEELISKNKIPLIVDYYFCTSCEKKLGYLEQEYSRTINLKTNTNAIYESTKQSFIAFLLWASIVWRLSILENSGFKLKQKEENKLKRILKKYLNKDLSKIIANTNDSDLSDIGYKLLRAPNYSDNNSTWLHWSPVYSRPYSFIIDEYLLFFYFKKSYLKGMLLDFYNTEKEKQLAMFNTPFNGEKIYGITDKKYEGINNNVLMFSTNKRLSTLKKMLDLLHQELGGQGKEMYPSLKKEIINRIVNSNEKIGQKDTVKHYAKIIHETFKEFFKK